MFDWLQDNETLMWWLAAASAAIFLATMVIVPIVLTQLPPDYFARSRKEHPFLAAKNPALRKLIRITKNVVGYLLILAGLLMLVLPGQGLLAILVGVILADFPGKERLLRWIVMRESVQKPINWLRRKAGKDPLRFVGKDSGSEKKAT